MKIIFFDIDGTLLDKGSGEVNYKTVGVLDLVRKNGFDYSIATGRGWPGVKKLGLDLHYPVVTELGSKIVDPVQEAVISKHLLESKDTAQLIFDLSENFPTVSFWTNEWKRKIYSANPEAIRREKKIFSEKTVDIIDNYQKLADAVFSSHPSLIRIEFPLNKIDSREYELKFHPFSSKSGFEITAPGVDKASGIIEAAKIMRVDLQNIYLIGNSERDLKVNSLLRGRAIILDNTKTREDALRIAVNKVLTNRLGP